MKHPLRLVLVLLAVAMALGVAASLNTAGPVNAIKLADPPVPGIDSVTDQGSGLGVSGKLAEKPHPSVTCVAGGTPIPVVTPAFTPGPGCSSVPGNGILDASITTHGATTEAVFTNHSQTCSYPIGLAVYQRLDNNIDHQVLYDYELAVIPPHSTLTLTVNNPPCAYQADAFYGDLLVSLAGGVRYGDRLLDDVFGNGHNYCPRVCPTPTLPPPPPTLPPPQPSATPSPIVTCPPGPPLPIVTPAFTPGPGCSLTPPAGVLSADITVNGTTTQAVFTNRSQTCSYPIGLAVYRRFDNNIDHQELYDYSLAVIPPHSTLTLTVNNPPCAFQADAFYGDLLVSLAGGVRYGDRLLDDVFGNGHNYCSHACPSPTPTLPPPPPTLPPPQGTDTPTPLPTCPPGPPGPIVTPAFTPGPGCSLTPRPGALEAVITDHPLTTEALFTNHSNTCSYPIGLAIYRKVDNNIDHQILYDYSLAVIPPHSTLVLTVNNPPCAYQADAFYGDLIVSFAGGVRYGERRLDDTDGGHGFCSPICPTPSATATGTVVPPKETPTATVTGTPPTATETGTPSKGTATPTEIGTPPGATATPPPATSTPTVTAISTVPGATATPPPPTSTPTVTAISTVPGATATRPPATSTPTVTPTVTPTNTPAIPCCSQMGVIIAPNCQFDPGNNWANITYDSQLTNNCTVQVNGNLTFFVDATNQQTPPPNNDPSWVQRASGTPIPVGFNGGQTLSFMDTFIHVPFVPSPFTGGDTYYRVRVLFDQGNNCVFTFYSDPDPVCLPTLAPQGPKPNDH